MAVGRWGGADASKYLLIGGAALLALQPLRWLGESWIRPEFDSQGLWFALASLGLLLWSLSSPRRSEAVLPSRYAYAILFASAGVRLCGQLLRVNVLSALTLAVDVYALATLAGTDRRERSLSPAWLSLLFVLSLPLERVVQRVLGYALQSVSADGACWMLRGMAQPVQCFGARIVLHSQDLLVDLPCSGARGLLLLLGLFAALAAVTQPRLLRAACGLGLVLLAAIVGNSLRLSLLALGLAYPQWIGGLPLMEAPWHELLGLLCLGLSGVPLLLWARRVPARPMPSTTIGASEPMRIGPLGAGLFAAACAAILLLPAHPMDVARPLPPPPMPSMLGGHAQIPATLTAAEQRYFSQFGGGASRASYGPFGLLQVSTTAPLRHLHAPDECLRSIGFDVRYIGLEHRGIPSALYRATAPDGRVWRVAVTYVSDDGQLAGSVGEAVWRWLRRGGGRWTQVQRAAPWETPPAERARFEAGVARALDLPSADEAVPRLHLAIPDSEFRQSV